MSENEEPSGFIPPDIEELSQGLPGYEFIDLLACGGMGAVYRARQTSLDRIVAIKILPPELAVDETFRHSFEAEGKAMAKVSHSNLVGVFNLGEVSDMLYLVMEFVEGSTLYQSKGDTAIDPETAVTLIRSVASGLAEAHRHDLVHRDIKPANIFINHDLVPKLGDFGLAVPDTDIESGLMMGTPAYLAPEVMENPMSASFASDTYALGVILYEMLTGRSIERGDELDLNIVPNLGDLPKIVRKSLNSQPLLRYQSGEALENDLRDWLRKPRNAGLAMNPGARVLQQSLTPSVSEESGGGGGLLIALVVLVLVLGGAWFVFGGTSDEDSGKTLSDSSEVDPGMSEDSEEEELKSLEELRTKQKKDLEELSGRIAEERSKIRLGFFEAAGADAQTFMASVPGANNDLPRYFLPDEVEISEELYRHLREYGSSRQGQTDRKYEREISSLHRNAIKEMRAAKVEFSKEIGLYWESWLQWLGKSRSGMMHESMVGLWHYSSDRGSFDLHLSSTGKNVLVVGEQRNDGQEIIEVSGRGEVSLQLAGDTTFDFPWSLSWRGDRLEGLDINGEQRVLRPGRFDYGDLVKSPDKPDVAPVKMEEVVPDDPMPEVAMFDDPQVASLTKNYHKALLEKIEALETGYLRVLKTSLESYREKDDEFAVEHLEKELARVGSINWRSGFMQLSLMKPPGKVSPELRKKQEVFQMEFKKRFEPLQRTYRVSLERMLRDRKAKRNGNLADLERALEMLKIPEGAVYARYVKIEALKDEGVGHSSIAMIEIVDFKGEDLPYKDFSDAKASSFEESDDGGKKRSPENAIDGDTKTIWHSKWKDPRAPFPHWISFDLGKEQLIKGFRIVPRHYQENRYTDVIKWRFHVSADRENWTVVASGNFSKGNHTKEHLGFVEVK